jgi:hypothetical protein
MPYRVAQNSAKAERKRCFASAAKKRCRQGSASTKDIPHILAVFIGEKGLEAKCIHRRMISNTSVKTGHARTVVDSKWLVNSDDYLGAGTYVDLAKAFLS